MILDGVTIAERRHSHILQQPLVAPRGGIMLHYDDSSRDDWALDWFTDPRCTNGYTWVVLDDGRIIELADPGMRTPHAGACRTPMANSHFYGIAATTNGLVPATDVQLAAIAQLAAALFTHHRWFPSIPMLTDRIVGHDEQAIWSESYTKNAALWGKTGRKVDPTGTRPDRQAVIDVVAIRQRVLALLA
jgi:N-acetyl-anhydromuramyl-L-alanine amidase AmpD